MVRKVLYPAVFVLAVLMAAPAAAAWDFWTCKTAEVSDGLEVLIYDSDGLTPVTTGALVQIIIGLDETEIVDPLEYFDTDDSGVVEIGSPEHAAMTAWLNAGADPAAISGGQNVLATATNFTGETAIGLPGAFKIDAVDETGGPYSIVPGGWFDKIAFRVWNISKDGMATFCERPEEEVWYMTGRELTSHDNSGLGPDDGWWIGMPGLAGGVEGDPGDWAGFNGLIGWEIINGLRTQYQLDTLLGVCPIPEPGTMLLIGGSVVLLLIRRKK